MSPLLSSEGFHVSVYMLTVWFYSHSSLECSWPAVCPDTSPTTSMRWSRNATRVKCYGVSGQFMGMFINTQVFLNNLPVL